MKPGRSRVVLASLLLVVAGALAVRSFHRVRATQRLSTTCDALAAGDFETALAASEGLEPGDETGFLTVECRCQALIATGHEPECMTLLEDLLLVRSRGDWLPSLELLYPLLGYLSDRGAGEAASQLARRATAAYPDSKGLLLMEWETRRAVEDEAVVVADFERRIQAGHAAGLELRLLLARAHGKAGRYEDALRTLGEPPAPGDHLAPTWHESRLHALAALGDPSLVRQAADDWLAWGGEPPLVKACYAIALAVNQLDGPELTVLELTREAVQTAGAIDDPRIEEAIWLHLVFQESVNGHYDEALEIYDRVSQHFAFEGFSREQILAAQGYEDFEQAEEVPRGTLLFRVSGAAQGSQLLISPSHQLPPDLPLEVHRVPGDGLIRVERPAWYLPYRWVLRGPEGRALASGSEWVGRGRETAVEVTPGAPNRPPRYERQLRPGDGRSRVWVLIHDCMDWRLARYMVARGELPVIETMLRTQHHAVVDSDPPFTGAALDALTNPRDPAPPTLLSLAYQMGGEMVDLTPTGRNPFQGLRWLLARSPGLFDTLSSGEHAVANLLFSHGAVDVGRNGEVLGPRGATRPPIKLRSARALTDAELTALPGLEIPEDRQRLEWLQEAAAVMDDTTELIEDESIDLLLVRVASLDTATHGHLAEVFGGQDDGRSLLLWYYRYLDRRTGQVWDRLDADDYLVVMSDHSIRNAMEHDRPSLFLLAGPDVPQGRAAGTPHISGVARVLADLLGVETPWPDTGVAPWLTAPE